MSREFRWFRWLCLKIHVLQHHPLSLKNKCLTLHINSMISSMANPRLDFFRFSLKHKSGQVKTFRDFMIENGKCTSRQKDITIF